jgi:hypothetical protein
VVGEAQAVQAELEEVQAVRVDLESGKVAVMAAQAAGIC